MENKKKLLKLTVLIAFSIIAIIIVEIALRVLAKHPDIRLMDMYVLQDNDLLPYKLRPNYKGYFIYSKLTVDAEGNRVVIPAPINSDNSLNQDESKTILIVGDSLVFGWGLNDNETVASQFQSLINEKGLHHRVKNIACPSYSTWNQYEVIRQYLEKNKVDIIILVLVYNDITYETNSSNKQINNYKRKYADYGPLKTFLYRNIYSISAVQRFVKNSSLFNNKSEVNAIPLEHSIERYTNKPVNYWYEKYLSDEGRINFWLEANLKIKQLCDESNTELIVVAPRFHLWDDAYPQLIPDLEKMIVERLNGIGIDVFITTSHMENMSKEEINVRINDAHPSSKAVKFMVQEVYEYLGDSL